MNLESFSDISWDLLHAPAAERKMYVAYFKVLDELLSGQPVKNIDFTGLPSALALRTLLLSRREDMFDAHVDWTCLNIPDPLQQDEEPSFVAEYLMSPERLVQWIPSRSTNRSREEAKEIQENAWSLSLQSQVLTPATRLPTFVFGKKDGTLGALAVALFSPHLPLLWSRIEKQSADWDHTEMAQAICMAVSTRKRWKVHTLGTFDDHDSVSSTSPSPFQYILSSVLNRLDLNQVKWDLSLDGRPLFHHVFSTCVQLLDDLSYWEKSKTKKQGIVMPLGIDRFMEYISQHHDLSDVLQDPASFGQVSCWRLLMSKSTPEQNSRLLKSWLQSHQNSDILYFPFRATEHVLSREEAAEVFVAVTKEWIQRLEGRRDEPLVASMQWFKNMPKPMLGELENDINQAVEEMQASLASHRTGQQKHSYPVNQEIERLALDWASKASFLFTQHRQVAQSRKL